MPFSFYISSLEFIIQTDLAVLCEKAVLSKIPCVGREKNNFFSTNKTQQVFTYLISTVLQKLTRRSFRTLKKEGINNTRNCSMAKKVHIANDSKQTSIVK